MYSFAPADFIGFSGACPYSDAINLATYGVPRWGLSHVGVIAEVDGRLLLFESNDTALPCVLRSEPTCGVAAHDIHARLETYRGKVWHYRWCRNLSLCENDRLSRVLVGFLGTPYDTIGAIQSGGAGLLRALVEPMLRPADLSQLFCSELSMAAYDKSRLYRTSDPSRYNPNLAARTLLRNRKVLYPVRLI